MSSHKDNTNHKKLKDLLDNQQSADPSMDDFEKEALEGFALLENEQEVFDLKAGLDKKIYSEVFTPEKKTERSYWYAAAGLLLVIGLSVYFVLNSSVSKEENLAIQSEEPVSKDEIQKDLDHQLENTKSLEFKQAPPTEKAEEKKAAPQKQSFEKGNILSSPKAENAAFESPAPSNAPQAAPVESDLEFSSSSTKSLENMDEKEAEMDKEIVQKEGRTVEKKQEPEIATVELKKSKSRRQEEAVPGGITASSAAGPASAVSYKGNLRDDLKKLLEKKNISKKFDATLFLDDKCKVQKVILTNEYYLTAPEKKEVIEILKNLNSFNVNNSAGKGLSEFKVVFNP